MSGSTRLPTEPTAVVQRTPGRNSPCPCGSGEKFKHCCANLASTSGAKGAYEQALEFQARGELNESAEACRRALRNDPHHGSSLRLLGHLTYRAGESGAALALFAQAVRAMPRDAGVHAELGALQLALRRPSEAITSLRQSLTLDPSSASACNDLGNAFQDLGRLDEAERAFRESLALDAKYFPAHYNLGELLRRRGRLDDARRHYEMALGLNPRLSEARAGLGDTLLAQGEFQAATACYREVIALKQATAAADYASLGIALREMDDRDGALEAFERAVALDPGLARMHFNLGSARLEFGRFADAIASLREALRLNPSSALVHTVYGMALAAGGDLEAGIASLRTGAPPETSDAHLFAILGAKLRGFGHYDAALECYQRVLHKEPDNLAARHFITALSGSESDHVAEQYVRQLSDAHADNFDRNLINELRYDVPRELAGELIAAGGNERPWDILDLGCGTGLVGVELAPHARSLVGVDLSRNMIERARARNCYTKFECANLLTALDRYSPHSFDVITAADVFVYIGRLDAVVSAVGPRLRTQGLFGFSTEAAENASTAAGASACEGYVLCATGRYAHTESYLRELALRNHFEIKLLRKTRIRFEHRQPIFGWLAIWMAPSHSLEL